MSYTFKDLDANGEIIYDFLYVFIVNFSHNMRSALIWPFNAIQSQLL